MNNTQQAGETAKRLTAEEFELLLFKLFDEGMRLGIAFPVMPSQKIVGKYFEAKIKAMYEDNGMVAPDRSDIGTKVYDELYRIEAEEASKPQSQKSEFFPDYNKPLQAPAPAPDAVEAKADESAKSKGILSGPPLAYFNDGYLAGHAEGQKATVEATELESGGIWVSAAERLPPIETRVIIKDNYGDVYVDSATSWDEKVTDYEWLDETPTSDAEGEKGAVEFAEWISVEDRWPEDEEELVIITAARKENGKRFVTVGRKGTFNYFLFDTVTHWMPLPPPPTK